MYEILNCKRGGTLAFSEVQKTAIKHKDGPMMVLAGPGSGKTLVITQRVKYLIENHGVSPDTILVITFTKAAAMEMQERFLKLMEDVPAPVAFGTFHSTFYGILRHAYNLNGSNILPEDKRYTIIKQIVEKLSLELDDEAEFISGVSGEISYVKGEMLDLEHYYSKNCSEDIFKKIYFEYEKHLVNSVLYDFDDMLVMCYRLFKEREDILSLWRNKYRFILIDEFQDINKVQYEVVKMLAAPNNNLFIVGDDDQSIYRFRGAKPEIMLGFPKLYPKAKSVLLNINYRCSGSVLKAALKLISNNKSRYEKDIKANNEMGVLVELLNFRAAKEECDAIISKINDYLKKGIDYSEIAVLYRTNINPRTLAQKLMEYNIPFRMKDVIPNLFEHWITKNLLSYIKIAIGNRDRSEFLQIVNRPKRYVSREAFLSNQTSFDELREFYKDKDWMIDRIYKFEQDINFIKDFSPFAAITYIRKAIGYDEFLKEYAAYRRMNEEELFDILEEIAESSKEFESYETWFNHMDKYTSELKEQAKNRFKVQEGISLSTMHSSKGLEYEVVFILDANEKVTPHAKAKLTADIEEERRLFYVAMTRAKKYLHIYSVKERYGKPVEISRFVGECLLGEGDIKEGRQIEHIKYGVGEIRKKGDNKMIVYFPKTKRELVLDIKYSISQRIIKVVE